MGLLVYANPEVVYGQTPVWTELMLPVCAGQEGFAGNSTPLYMYSNPGAWASLMGVDYVRNNKAKGIDYSTMHVYTDQWLCVAEGATTQGQLDFMKCGPSASIPGASGLTHAHEHTSRQWRCVRARPRRASWIS